MTPVTPEDDAELDAPLEVVHSKLDKQIQRARKKRKATPTQGFNMRRIKKTKQAFQAMSEEDFSLEDSREVVQQIPEEKKKEQGSTSIFGKLFGSGRPATA